MRTVIVVLVLVSFMAEAAIAADNRIIVQAIGITGSDRSLNPLSEGFSDLLVAYLSAYEELEILYREDMHRLWQELARDHSGLERTDVMRIGALIQANTLIKGGFINMNGSFRANVHVYDIATAQLQYSIEESGDIENVDVLASSIAQRIADRLINHRGDTVSMPGDAQPLVNTHFMKGLGYYYSGLYSHSVAEFMSVIELDPARADARIWLGKSYVDGGEPGHARIEFERFLQDFPNHEDGDTVIKALDTLAN